MRFQYRAGYGGQLRWWFAKTWAILLLAPVGMTLLNLNLLDGERLILSWFVYYLIYLIPLWTILFLGGLLITLVSQLKYRQGGKIISVVQDEKGICETAGERCAAIGWDEARWVHIGRTYVDIIGRKTILFIRKNDVGYETYEALKTYVGQKKGRRAAKEKQT